MKLNRKLITFFAIYLLLFFALAISYSLLVTFLTSLGYTATERSVFFVGDALFGMMAQVGLGYLCDRFGKVKPFIYGCFALYVACTYLLYGTVAKSFFMHLILVMIVGGMMRITNGLMDSFTMEQSEEFKENYGVIRLFGSIGWALGSPVAAMIVTRYGYPALGTGFFAVAAVMLLLVLAVSDVHVKRGNETISLENVRDLFRNRGYLVVIIILFVLFCVDTTQSYTVIDKMMYLNGTEQDVGNYWAVAAMLELPMFFLGGRLIKKYGAMKLCAMAAIVYATRYVIYALATRIIHVFIAGVLQAITYPVLMVTSKVLVDEQSPDNMKISGQQVGLSVYGSGSALVSPLVCGILTDNIGVNNTLLLIALTALVGFVLCVLSLRKPSNNIQ